jgi:hypothetical protein
MTRSANTMNLTSRAGGPDTLTRADLASPTRLGLRSVHRSFHSSGRRFAALRNDGIVPPVAAILAA